MDKEDLGALDMGKNAKERFAWRKKQREEAERLKAMGMEAPEEVQEAPEHQSKESNLVSRGRLDAEGLEQLPPPLRDTLLAARDPARLREAAQRRARTAGHTQLDLCIDAPRGIRQRSLSGGSPESAKPPAQRPRRGECGEGIAANRPPADAVEDSFAICPPVPMEAHSQSSSALKMWEELRCEGRYQREWEPNELRLIATHVIPLLPEHTQPKHLPWRQVDLALDTLMGIIDTLPADAIFPTY